MNPFLTFPSLPLIIVIFSILPPALACHHCPKSPSTATPSPPATCPADTVKLGACVELVGGLVHIGLGDAVGRECCPLLKGLAQVEAAACLCTTLKLKLLNINIYLPLALQLLIQCGKSVPPGFSCTVDSVTHKGLFGLGGN